MIPKFDRPCERWTFQEAHGAHIFKHSDGWAKCPGWVKGQNGEGA